MLLQELFKDNKIKFSTNGLHGINWDAYAELPNGSDFAFTASLDNDIRWSVSFTVDGSYEMTNDKHNGVEVFSLVVDIMKQFVAECKPMVISFTGDKDHQALYQRLVKRYFPDWDVDIGADFFSGPGGSEFTISCEGFVDKLFDGIITVTDNKITVTKNKIGNSISIIVNGNELTCVGSPSQFNEFLSDETTADDVKTEIEKLIKGKITDVVLRTGTPGSIMDTFDEYYPEMDIFDMNRSKGY